MQENASLVRFAGNNEKTLLDRSWHDFLGFGLRFRVSGAKCGTYVICPARLQSRSLSQTELHAQFHNCISLNHFSLWRIPLLTPQ